MAENNQNIQRYKQIIIILILILLIVLSIFGINLVIIDMESENPDSNVLIETNNTTQTAEVTVLRNNNVDNFIIADKGNKSSKKLLGSSIGSSVKLNVGSKSGSIIVASNVSGSHKIMKVRDYNFNSKD